MIRSIIGALIGSELDRNRRTGGLRGAATGMIAARVLSRMGPLGMVLGGGYVAMKAYDRHKAEKAMRERR